MKIDKHFLETQIYFSKALKLPGIICMSGLMHGWSPSKYLLLRIERQLQNGNINRM